MSRVTHAACVLRHHNQDLIVSMCTNQGKSKEHLDVYVHCDQGVDNNFFKDGEIVLIQCDLAPPVDNMPAIRARFITPAKFERRFESIEEKLELEQCESNEPQFTDAEKTVLNSLFKKIGGMK